jgi:energy-coupling factor transport system ATP-binding protein
VLVATHDAEFAAAWADRTVLLGDGQPVADAPTSEVLGGGWYFATQTARVLGGGALTPDEGAALLRAGEVVEPARAPGAAVARSGFEGVAE